MPLTSGSRLGHYEILAPLGAGGMGEVYRARDTKLGREVAVKVLPDAFSRDPEKLARFEREAHLLASVNHPNIATLYGLEESNGQQYLVMELVEGETLAERLVRGPIVVDEALPLFQHIAEGLEAAHEKGVIHRDLKPSNIKITPEGMPKILDFGLAKALAGEPGVQDLSQSPTLTREATETGVLLGTAPYMSPEQARGKPVDKRTDIWAFGCCLYEALTGKAAFLGETVSDTIAAILDREPDWKALPQGTPPWVRALLQRCLEKNARRRLQHIGDARIELEDVGREPSEASGVPVAKPSRAPLVAMSFVTLIAMAVATWSLLHGPSPRAVVRTVIPLPPDKPLALQYGGALAISPDRRVVAYVAERGGTAELYLQHLDQADAMLVEGSEGASTPFFSPDGQWVGFIAGSRSHNRKVSVSGGASVVVPGSSGDRGAAWGDGMLYFSGGLTSGITKYAEDGGEPEVVTEPVGREKAHRYPEILPGGGALVYTAGTRDIASWDEASIVVVSLETGESRVLIEGGMNARYSPSGHLVYARGGSLLAVPFDVDALEVTGAPVTVLEGVAMSHISGGAEYGLSRDGWLVYAPGGMWGANRVVVSMDREGRAEPLVDAPRAFMDPEISPDGRRIAVDIMGANDSIWIGDLSRGTLSRLAFGSDNLWPIWTPDGEKVVFSSNRDGSYNLFWQIADGTAEAEALAPRDGVSQHAGSWTPDGDELLFVQERDIWLRSADGEEPLLEEEYGETHPRVSPSGRWLAYVSDESGQNEVYVQRFPELGQKQQVSLGGGTEPLWNPKAKELFYRNGTKLMALAAEERDGRLALGEPQLLFERSSPMELLAGIFNTHVYDITPDGERFVTIAESEPEPPPTHLVLIQNWAEELTRLVPFEN